MKGQETAKLIKDEVADLLQPRHGNNFAGMHREIMESIPEGVGGKLHYQTSFYKFMTGKQSRSRICEKVLSRFLEERNGGNQNHVEKQSAVVSTSGSHTHPM